MLRETIFKREKSIVISAPAEKIFRYLTSVLQHSEWAANPLEIYHVGGPQSGTGALFKTVIHRPAGVTGRFKGEIRVVAEEYPNRFVYETRDRTGHYQWSFLLSAEGNGSKLTHQLVRLSGPWVLRFLQPLLLWPLIGSRQVQTGLEKIKLNLEKHNSGVRP